MMGGRGGQQGEPVDADFAAGGGEADSRHTGGAVFVGDLGVILRW